MRALIWHHLWVFRIWRECPMCTTHSHYICRHLSISLSMMLLETLDTRLFYSSDQKIFISTVTYNIYTIILVIAAKPHIILVYLTQATNQHICMFDVCCARIIHWRHNIHLIQQLRARAISWRRNNTCLGFKAGGISMGHSCEKLVKVELLHSTCYPNRYRNWSWWRERGGERKLDFKHPRGWKHLITSHLFAILSINSRVESNHIVDHLMSIHTLLYTTVVKGTPGRVGQIHIDEHCPS